MEELPLQFYPSPSLNQCCISGIQQDLAVPFIRLPSRLQVCGSEFSLEHNSTVGAESVNYFSQKGIRALEMFHFDSVIRFRCVNLYMLCSVP